MSDIIEQTTLLWRGIKMEVVYKSNYFDSSNGFSIAHLDITTENRVPLHFTETGYRSHFFHASEIEEYGTPIDFLKAWLEESAKSKTWKAYEKKKNQLTLF